MEIMNSFLLVASLVLLLPTYSKGANSRVFREYIGAEFNNVKFTEVPINPNVHFDFILAFAVDYTQSSSPSPTNGKFNACWDTANLSPREVRAIKNRHSNVRVALSLGGDTVGNATKVQFVASSVASWVNNAVSSLSRIIREYDLDGIDVDYEHFDRSPQPAVFAECIGQLITTLKRNRVVSVASIAPFDDHTVQAHYGALWRKYGHVIDYVNFQFYAYDRSTTVAQFIRHYREQGEVYKRGRVLASFGTDSASEGLSADKGFFRAAAILKKGGKLEGIFVWSADDSKRFGFRYEKQAQALLAL